MEKIVIYIDKYLNLAPQKKVNFLYLVIILALSYLIFYNNKRHESNYDKLLGNYNILDARCNSVYLDYQKKINDLQEKRQNDFMFFNEKMEKLYQKNEQIENKIK